MKIYRWSAVDEFLDRDDELATLEQWWTDRDRMPLALLGRRRVGKSWLFRRFLHGKPGFVLVARQLPAGAQLTGFADQIEDVTGLRPDLPDVAALFRTLYRFARDDKIVVAIDEFPWLLGSTSTETRVALSAAQAVMEDEQPGSKLKLILCGSHIGTMESLFSEQNPMHGRLRRFEVRPLPFADAKLFLDQADPVDAFERYGIAGGMPLYLSRLGDGDTRDAVCRAALDRDGPLFNEGRSLLEQELREPRVYFAVLQALASGAREANEIAQPLRLETNVVGKYLDTLAELRLVSRSLPLGASPSARKQAWSIDDPFLRFWFRFVFPFQDDLESGLRPRTLFDTTVEPNLADHLSPVFEDWCGRHLRAHYGSVATKVGRWWGNAANTFRRAGERSSEEIDAIGLHSGRVTLVSEAKWTNKPLGMNVLNDLETYKVPALRDAKLKVAKSLTVVLYSRSGYADALFKRAATDNHLELVDVPAALAADAVHE